MSRIHRIFIGRIFIGTMLTWIVTLECAWSAATEVYDQRVWTILDGLPQSEVTDLVQTRDGILWIGTFGGLVRFDGTNFDVFDLTTHPELKSHRVVSLLETRDGTLWIGTQDQGLVQYRDGTFSAPFFADDLPQTTIWSMFEDARGRLWIGTNRNLVRVDLTAKSAAKVENVGGFRESVFQMVEYPEGTIWAASGCCLTRIENDQVVPVADRMYRSLLLASDNSVWAGTQQEVTRWLADGSREDYAIPSTGQVSSILEAKDGSIWIDSAPHPVRWMNGVLAPIESEPSSQPSNITLRSGVADQEGSLWFGSSAGLRRYRRSAILGFTKPWDSNCPRSVAVDGNGVIWVSLYNNALAILSERGFELVAPADLDDDVGAIFADKDGSIVAVHGDQLVRHTSAVDSVPIEANPVAYATDNARKIIGCFSAFRDSRDDVWIGNQEGVVARLRGDDADIWDVEDGLPSGSVISIYERSDGSIYIGSTTGLGRIVGDAVTNLWVSGKDLPPGTVRALWEDDLHHLWIGTYGGGLCRMDDYGEVHRIGITQGLYESVVSRIVPDGRGNLVLQGNRALSLIPLQAARDVIEGKLPVLHPRIFNRGPRIGLFEGMGGAMPLECRAPDGTLWFPTLEGVVRFDPDAVDRIDIPPPVRVTSLIVDGVPYDPKASVQIPPGDRNVYIRFAATTFVEPEQTRFRHRLLGYHENWIEGSEGTYTHVPPGNYTFQVLAANRDGVWSPEGAGFEMTVKPWIHETTWFRTVAALFLLLLTGLAIWQRTRRIRQRAHMLEREVASRTVELREAHSHLEEKVAVRTQELANALDSLREDMEKREQLETQLRESQKIEVVGRLSGGLAHDFNNILTAVLGEADFVKNSVQRGNIDPAVLTPHIDEITHASTRAANLTRQLLAYSRNQILQPQVFNPNETLTNLSGMLRRLIREDLELETRRADNAGYIKVDPGQLEQVIINLVVNARDAIDGHGKITISTSSVDVDEATAAAQYKASAGPHTVIKVTDSGTGVSEQIIDRIFDPFFTTKAPGRGTGLGLASVHGIVTQSGGHVRVRSSSQGTTFEVYFPSVPPPNNCSRSIIGEAKAPLAANESTILLTDDEPTVLRITALMLRRFGHFVLTSSSPTHALEIARAHDAIDLLITDVVMPEMNGVELARKVRAIHPEMGVLYVSGYSSTILEQETDLDETSAFLHKPYTTTELASQVSELLTRVRVDA